MVSKQRKEWYEIKNISNILIVEGLTDNRDRHGIKRKDTVSNLHGLFQ